MSHDPVEASAPDNRREWLRAGPLTMAFDSDSGFLRYIRCGKNEVLRGIYVAVRDHNWSTVPPEIRDLVIDQRTDSFHISFTAECRRGDVGFEWSGKLSGSSAGALHYQMDGRAHTTFRRNRIGFCVLHPSGSCAGRPCIIEHTDGRLEEGSFPRLIAPHQPFRDIRMISHEVIPGLRARVVLAGEVFEMEDQRNWTDASFKTYSTPLDLPFPVEVEAGTIVRQSVELSLPGSTAEPAAKVSVGTRDAPIRLRLGQPVPLPRIGLGTASHGRPLSSREADRLRQIRPDHLRVDLQLSQSHDSDVLRQVAADARALRTSLHVALHIGEPAADDLQRLRALLEEIRPPVAMWLVLQEQPRSTSPSWVEQVRSILLPLYPDSWIATGTNADFAELNRARPTQDAVDFLCYSINPQVHASDDDSLMESLEAQAETVFSAQQFAGHRSIVVSPVTPRHGVLLESLPNMRTSKGDHDSIDDVSRPPLGHDAQSAGGMEPNTG